MTALLIVAALVQAAPEGSTLFHVLAKGTVLSVAGMDVPMTYKPDGVLEVAGQFTGRYRLDGKRLCIEVEELALASCATYPDGKKPGDAFTVDTDLGPVEVKIRS